MQFRRSNRRAFLKESFTVAATAALLQPAATLFGEAPAAQSGLRPLRLGGPSFAATDDPEGLALAHRKLGYRAAYCPAVALKDADRIKALAEAFDRMAGHLDANGVDITKDNLELGQPLKFDPRRERFVDNDQANAFVSRDYRAPFIVPLKV